MKINKEIKLNKRIQGLTEVNKKLQEKVKRQKTQAEINHDRENELKCELMKLNPNHKFDNSKKLKLKNSIREGDDNLCCFCRRNIYDVSTDETLHHKIPRRYGGLDNPENLITICSDCHRLLETLIGFVESKVLELGGQKVTAKSSQ